MQPKIYFVTGVNGVGKSSVMPYLRELLPSKSFNVRDFDERGVPDGADHAWRKEEVRKWLEVGRENVAQGVSTIICGFVKEKDYQDFLHADHPEITIICLDADTETIRKRLMGRYTKDGVFDENQKVIGKPVMEFIAGNVYYADIMRKEEAAEGHPVIDTSNITSKEVAQKIVQLIGGKL